MGWMNGGCGCGETPPDVARINRSISFYLWRQIPTGELEQTIGWLDDIKRDCEFKISEIESIKRDRERVENWRKNMNKLAKQFYDDDALHLDVDTRQKIVQQRLGCEPNRARHIAENVHAWAKRQRRKNRDAEICMKRRAGVKPKDLAAEYGISRQQIHNIVKNDDKTRFLR
jgi:hypothetical protein